jgi:hypothetical protein
MSPGSKRGRGLNKIGRGFERARLYSPRRAEKLIQREFGVSSDRDPREAVFASWGRILVAGEGGGGFNPSIKPIKINAGFSPGETIFADFTRNIEFFHSL